MSWIAHVRRVPADWNYEDFKPWRDGYPTWSKEERTHLQFWQDKTDPCPISPIFATYEELAAYALKNVHWPYFSPFEGAPNEEIIRWLKEETY